MGRWCNPEHGGKDPQMEVRVLARSTKFQRIPFAFLGSSPYLDRFTIALSL